MSPPRPRPWFRALCLGLVRVYYPWIEVAGRDRVPTRGPVVVVANHPNGLLDPLLVSLAVGRPVAFLAKSTFWKSPLGRFATESFGAMPVYRAHEDDPKKNEATFARCRALLAGGGWLALFPEGKSHDAPQLAPLKTGAARIALGAEEEAGWGLGLHILPVGLLYEEKAVFRSRVSARVGEAIPVAPSRAAYAADPRAAADALTDRVADALGEVVVQADDEAVWRGILSIAEWRAASAGLADTHAEALRLAALARRAAVESPEALQRVVGEMRQLQRIEARIGRQDPARRRLPEVGELAALAALAGPAAVGAALGWVPYRLVRPIAERLAKGHRDILGTIKILLGALVLSLTWLGWVVAAGLVAGPLAALGMAVGAPLCAWAAVRFDELLTARVEELAARVAARDPRVAELVDARRARILAAVEAALDASPEA